MLGRGLSPWLAGLITHVLAPSSASALDPDRTGHLRAELGLGLSQAPVADCLVSETRGAVSTESES